MFRGLTSVHAWTFISMCETVAKLVGSHLIAHVSSRATENALLVTVTSESVSHVHLIIRLNSRVCDVHFEGS